MKCEICGKDFSSYKGLSFHISHAHSDFGLKLYYDTYIKSKNEGFMYNM